MGAHGVVRGGRSKRIAGTELNEMAKKIKRGLSSAEKKDIREAFSAGKLGGFDILPGARGDFIKQLFKNKRSKKSK